MTRTLPFFSRMQLIFQRAPFLYTHAVAFCTDTYCCSTSASSFIFFNVPVKLDISASLKWLYNRTQVVHSPSSLALQVVMSFGSSQQCGYMYCTSTCSQSMAAIYVHARTTHAAKAFVT